MAEQNTNTKIQPLLAAWIARNLPATPETQQPDVQVLILIQNEAGAALVRTAVERLGGTVIVQRQNEIESQLPSDKVASIARINQVLAIRMARIHSAY